MALRLLHFADLQLDRSFAAQRLSGSAAQRRREDLRAALVRIVERAHQERVDLITCGGDLFEHDYVTRETANFAAETLGSAGCPVLIAPGDRDPARPSSPYRYLRWPSNIAIAAHEELRPYRYDSVEVWSAGFVRGETSESPLAGFEAPAGGPHLLLLHASDMGALPEGTIAYAPITAGQVEQANFVHALLGHYHAAQTSARLTYPGTPEPLEWDEDGRHCIALLTLSEDGVEVRLEDINRRRFVEESMDITGMHNIQEALRSLRDSKHLQDAIVRVSLQGERSCLFPLDVSALVEECQDGFAHLELLDQTRRSHDIQSIASEFTSRGEMVRQLLSHGEAPGEEDTARRALQLALDAFEG